MLRRFSSQFRKDRSKNGKAAVNGKKANAILIGLLLPPQNVKVNAAQARKTFTGNADGWKWQMTTESSQGSENGEASGSGSGGNNYANISQDNTAGAQSITSNGGNVMLLDSWLKDVAAEQKTDGKGVLPLVTPNAIPFPYMAQAIWGDVVVSAPWDLYQAFGDKTLSFSSSTGV